MTAARRFTVRVPATSANLGCAFDCAALALGLYLDTTLTTRVDEDKDEDSTVTVRYSGPTAERVRQDERNLIARVIKDRLAEKGNRQGFDLNIKSEIPIGVGLGSSAAAIVTGLALAAKVLNEAPNEAAILKQATAREGHPDNVAAAWHGGFVLAVTDDNEVSTSVAPVPEDLKLVLVVPDFQLPTEETRRSLPASYSRQDAVHNLQRATALAAQFFSGKPQLEGFLFDDRWHQPYRARLVPGLEAALAFRHPSLLGICLSGAGSSVLAFARERSDEIGRAITACFENNDIKTQTFFLAPDNRGAKGWLENG